MNDKQWSAYRKEVFEAVEQSNGHFFCRELSEELELHSKSNKEQVHQLVLDLLHKYTNRPALRWQFEQWLTDKEKAEYTELRKRTSVRLSAQCSKCGSTHIKRVIYGMPDFETMNEAKYIYAGCVVGDDDPQYQCADCGKQYKTKPLMKQAYI